MKQITIRIDDEQYNELKNISEKCKIRNVSWLIRIAIDYYLINHKRKEALYEHDKHI